MSAADAVRITKCWRCGVVLAGPQLRPEEPRTWDTATCGGCRAITAPPKVGRNATCPPKFRCDPCERRGFLVAATTLGCGSGYYCARCADIRERCRECDRPRDEMLYDADDTGHKGGFIG